jgi:4-alpha-glucanotransferase
VEVLARLVESIALQAASGCWRPQGKRSGSATLLVAPAETYQGDDPRSRQWALAVQLYAIRSHRNWGHEDFTDLLGLIDLASELGAAAIGLNPASRLFRGEPLFTRQPAVLNLLYIDLDAVSEFAGLKTAEMEETIDRLRRQDLFDYLGVPHGEMARSREGLQDLLHIVNARAAERPRMLSRTR